MDNKEFLEKFNSAMGERLRSMSREFAEFEAAHPELREIWRREGAMAYHLAMSKVLQTEREWPEVVYEDVLDAEFLEMNCVQD